MTKDLCPKIPHACLLNVVAKTLKWWEDGLRVTRQGSESYCTVGMIVSCWTPCLSSENSGHQDLGWNPKGKAPIHQIYHLTWFCLSHKVHIACTLLPPMMWVADTSTKQTRSTSQNRKFSSQTNVQAHFVFITKQSVKPYTLSEMKIANFRTYLPRLLSNKFV